MPCVPSCWAGCLWKDRGTPARMSLGQVGGWVGIGPLQPHRRNDFPQPTCILAPLCEVLLELAFVLGGRNASLLINNASKVVCTALCHQVVLRWFALHYATRLCWWRYVVCEIERSFKLWGLLSY